MVEHKERQSFGYPFTGRDLKPLRCRLEPIAEVKATLTMMNNVCLLLIDFILLHSTIGGRYYGGPVLLLGPRNARIYNMVIKSC